jgi:hypothetical protein
LYNRRPQIDAGETVRSRIVFLGPQRFEPTLRRTLDSLGVSGAVGVVTAGWQERESEDKELREHLGCEVVDLLLYHRYDDVLLRDRELATALDQRGQRMRQHQELYRLRLDYALEAARAVMRREGRGGPLDDHRRGALRVLRSMDRQHLQRLRRIHNEFARVWKPTERIAVRRHRQQLESLIENVDAVAVAGGHVAVLLNRMRLFDLVPLLANKLVVAWSAGAMAVSERVVLFHDSPPQGAGNPEVFDVGLGLSSGVQPLPHADRRLQLTDPVRMSLFARRFSPATCAILDPVARMDWDGQAWNAGPGTRTLTRSGRVHQTVGA